MVLEPRIEKAGTLLLDEMETTSEILFVDRGTVAIGYEVNHQKYYILKYKNLCVLGAYGLVFDQRTEFLFTAITDVQGFCIRRENWKNLLRDNKEVEKAMKISALQFYQKNIKLKIMPFKKRTVDEFNARNDIQFIIASKQKSSFKDNLIAFDFAVQMAEVDTREMIQYNAFFNDNEAFFEQVENSLQITERWIDQQTL